MAELLTICIFNVLNVHFPFYALILSFIYIRKAEATERHPRSGIALLNVG